MKYLFNYKYIQISFGALICLILISSCKDYNYQWGIPQTDSWGRPVLNLRSAGGLDGLDYYHFGVDNAWTLTITSPPPKSKDVIIQNKKEEKWYNCNGIFEYYVTEDYPTASEWLKVCYKTGYALKRIPPFRLTVDDWGKIYRLSYEKYYDRTPLFGKKEWTEIAETKRYANAIIKIEPYSTHPQVYHIDFDGASLVIDLGTVNRWDWYNKKK